MLRDSAADAVVRLVAEKPGVRLNYFEPGAGVSTVMIYKRLLEASEDIGRVFGTLLEPSAQRLEAACAELKKLGLMAGKNYRPRVLKDTDALFAADPDSQDIIVSVAQIHHHSYLDEPMQALHAVTKPGGYIVITDWHNSMWEHPAMVYDFLRGFEWETKEKDLAEFARVFPEALQKTPAEASAKDSAANNMIRRFWRDGWAKVRAEAIAAGTFQPEDDIIMLEGHRPVERYEEEMAKAGYQLDAGFTPNPLQILPDSGILNRIIGRKPR
jgi:SAM-dependent methyltransferase